MDAATRTSEGVPYRCSICGKKMIVTASDPLGEIVCPHCGVLCFPNVTVSTVSSDDEYQLAQKGIFVETNDEGEIIQLYFKGSQYNDETLSVIQKFFQVPFIDVTFTALSPAGVAKLRDTMPGITISFDRED